MSVKEVKEVKSRISVFGANDLIESVITSIKAGREYVPHSVVKVGDSFCYSVVDKVEVEVEQDASEASEKPQEAPKAKRGRKAKAETNSSENDSEDAKEPVEGEGEDG